MDKSRTTPPPTPIEIIDWLNDEGLVDLDVFFPEDGNLFEAGLDSMAVMQLVVAVEECYGVVLETPDLTKKTLATPTSLAALIASKM
ncbi:MAG: phosphopantetheine-binding protein [Luteolibacter sp.]